MADQRDLARIEERLDRLEVGHAFGERAADALSAEVFALARRLEELSMRVAALERAKAAADSAADGPPTEEEQTPD